MSAKHCKIFGAPMIVFLVLSLGTAIGLIFVKGSRSKKIGFWIGFIFWAIVIGVILYLLLRSCHRGWAWFFVIIYFIFNLGLILGTFLSVGKKAISKV